MTRRIWITAACLLAASIPAAAQVAPAPSAIGDLEQRKAAGLRLAQLLYPLELQVGVGKNILRNQFAPTLMKDPNFKAMEAEFPGLLEALVTELEPVFTQWITAELPGYHRGIGDFYGSNFALGELQEIHRFFSTPTGRKISQGVQMNLKIDSVMAEAVGNPDAPTTKEAVESDLATTVAETLKAIDKSDEPELMRFGSAPWFPKLKAFRPKLIAFETEFMNRPAPKFEAEITKIMEKTMEKFLAEAQRKAAA